MTTAIAPLSQAAGSDATVRAEVRNGTLLTTHGVISACAHCQAQLVTAGIGTRTALVTATPVGYGANELAAAFHLPAPSVGAAGGTVAIASIAADPNLESDLATYRAQFGLPPCTTANGCLKVADYQGGPPLAPDPSAQGQEFEAAFSTETSMDMEMASAACPSCKLIELQLPDADGVINSEDVVRGHFGTAAQTAVALGATAFSMSYIYGADTTGAPSRALFHPGLAVVASSGDRGFQGTQQVVWPQSLPWVIDAGGISLHKQGNTYTETAWSGAGSACEGDMPPAIGQPPSVSANCGGHRATSDVSAVADPNTGVAVYDTYFPGTTQRSGWFVNGGTSASSPVSSLIICRSAPNPGRNR